MVNNSRIVLTGGPCGGKTTQLLIGCANCAPMIRAASDGCWFPKPRRSCFKPGWMAAGKVFSRRW